MPHTEARVVSGGRRGEREDSERETSRPVAEGNVAAVLVPVEVKVRLQYSSSRL